SATGWRRSAGEPSSWLFAFLSGLRGAPGTPVGQGRNPTAWRVPAARPSTAARRSAWLRPVASCSVTMVRNWRPSLVRAVRLPSAPVTHTLVAVCCLVFLFGPASGLNPAHGTGGELLAVHRPDFWRW